MARLSLCFFIFLVTTFFSNHAVAWEYYFDDPEYYEVKISPDGKTLGIVRNDKGKRVLVFFDRTSNKSIGGLGLGGYNEVGPFYWANNDRVVIKVYQRKPSELEPQFYGELYAVNTNGKKGEMIYGYRAGEQKVGSRMRKKESTYGWAEIIDILPDDPRSILISSERMDSQGDGLRIVYKLDIYTGLTRDKLYAAPVPGTRYMTNKQGQLVVATGVSKDLTNEVYLNTQDGWKEVPSENFGNDFYPLALDETGSTLYVLDDYRQDKTGVFKLNLSNGEYKNLYTNDEADVTSVEYTATEDGIYAIRLDKERLSYVMLKSNDEEATIFKSLLQMFPGSHVSITSKTADGSLYIVHVGSDINPGEYYIFDKVKNTLALLFKSRSSINPDAQFEKQPFSFRSSDGLNLRGYFTEARAPANNKKPPLVILPHGGPHARDYWEFDPTVQALASNGYSVLQVNFRGSSGYGNQFMRAGYGAWGTDIQRDIFEAYQWAIKNGKAEANQACIMGASFGAYSAMQSVINYPTTYRCAIGNAGVYDLPYLYKKGDLSRYYFGAAYLQQTLGSDTEKLKQMSPTYNYEKIQVPVFITHGKKDERAPYANAKKFEKALSKAKIDYEWYSVSGEGHGFYDSVNQKKYMKKVFAFLDKHLQ